MSLTTLNEQPQLIVDFEGNRSWKLNGEFHRTDGPAFESCEGNRYWYINGVNHREDGPAVELANGYKAWRMNGVRHRMDGPAIECPDGTKQWWINGQEYSYDVWKWQFHPALMSYINTSKNETKPIILVLF